MHGYRGAGRSAALCNRRRGLDGVPGDAGQADVAQAAAGAAAHRAVTVWRGISGDNTIIAAGRAHANRCDRWVTRREWIDEVPRSRKDAAAAAATTASCSPARPPLNPRDGSSPLLADQFAVPARNGFQWARIFFQIVDVYIVFDRSEPIWTLVVIKRKFHMTGMIDRH